MFPEHLHSFHLMFFIYLHVLFWLLIYLPNLLCDWTVVWSQNKGLIALGDGQIKSIRWVDNFIYQYIKIDAEKKICSGCIFEALRAQIRALCCGGGKACGAVICISSVLQPHRPEIDFSGLYRESHMNHRQLQSVRKKRGKWGYHKYLFVKGGLEFMKFCSNLWNYI